MVKKILILLALFAALALAAACCNMTPTGDSWSGLSDMVNYNIEDYTERNTINYLIIGVDSSEERIEAGYAAEGEYIADTLIVATLDLSSYEIYLTMIPRDTVTTITIYNSVDEMLGYSDMQIGLQYPYGGESKGEHMMDCVSELFGGLELSGYVVFDMDDVVALVDGMGGISFGMPYDVYFCAYAGYWVGEWVTLDGADTLMFLTWRDKTTFASTQARVERQKTFLYAIIINGIDFAKSNPIEFVQLCIDTYKSIDIEISYIDIYKAIISLPNFETLYIWTSTVAGETIEIDSTEYYIYDDEALGLYILETYFTTAIQEL